MAEPGFETTIEVDPAVLENDSISDYESAGYSTETQSLTSSINEYVFENGRRYHAYFGVDKNPMPTDEKEQDRLDLHHEIMLNLADGKLHLAPIKNPHRILDIGTGTGIWAIDMADLYPSAEVIGTDISPIQPAWVPPNCKFEVDDAEREWTFRSDHFDLIHARNLSQSIETVAWPKLMAKIKRCLEPGGWVELAELGSELYSDDNTMAPGNGLKVQFGLVRESMELIGRSFPDEEALRKRLIDAGFEDVHCVNYKHPIGPWAKDKKMKHIGAMVLLSFETGLEAYGMAALTRIMKMSPEEAGRIIANAWKATKNKNFHIYSYYHVAYGRKPHEVAAEA